MRYVYISSPDSLSLPFFLYLTSIYLYNFVQEQQMCVQGERKGILSVSHANTPSSSTQKQLTHPITTTVELESDSITPANTDTSGGNTAGDITKAKAAMFPLLCCLLWNLPSLQLFHKPLRTVPWPVSCSARQHTP